MKVKFLDLKFQYNSIKQHIDSAIFEVIESTTFIGGEKVSLFERDFANFLNTDFCIGVGNGTDALEIALESLGLEVGSEIIVPANSFIATSEAVSRNGLIIRFVDVHPETNVLDLVKLESAINNNTKCIIAVHLYGYACEMDELIQICKERELYLIEDCAQAHGTLYNGKAVGTFGDLGCFSFYPGKTLGAYGDGGCVVTSNSGLATKVRMIANHGRIDKYNHEFEGRNSRLDTLQAAILQVKLKYLPNWINIRSECAARYRDGLANLDFVRLPPKSDLIEQSYHLFVVQAEYRDELRAFLTNSGVQTGVHYPTPLPLLPAYKGNADNNYSVAVELSKSALSLPLGEHLSLDEIDYVVEKVKEFYKC